MKVVALLLLIGVASARTLNDDAKNRPVTKVINLLKDMQSQLEKEGEEDEEVYDRMVCWCETNDKEKTKAIADAEQHLTDLAASIEEMSGNSARLASEISNLEMEVAKSTMALDQATALRTKELGEFNAEEKDNLQSIASLKSAVTVLGKHHGSFLQDSSSDDITKVAHLAKKLLNKKGLYINPQQRRTIVAFTKSPMDFVGSRAFLQAEQAPSAGSYAPQGGQIFGILKNMKESFEANVAANQKDETQSVAMFQELKAAKEKEIAAGNDQVFQKTQERAAADEKHATDTQDRDDTQASLDADREFLAMLKGHCADMDAQMEQRQKTRALEIEAVSKALSIISGDDAHDLYTRNFNFVQKASLKTSIRRQQVVKLLEKAAARFNDPKIALLASSVKLDAFKKVKESIEKMVNQLVVEKEDEIKFKDYCIDAMNTNEANTETKTKEKADLEADKDSLTNEVAVLKGEVDRLSQNIADMQKEMKRAGEDREIENKEFNAVVADQRATQRLLLAALQSLKGFYGLVQKKQNSVKQAPAGPPPPPGFKNYENNKNSGGVMGMIQQIVNDSKAMEAEAIRGEEDAQKAYEDFVKDTNKAVDAANVEITNKSESKAKAEGELAETQGSLDAAIATLDTLDNENKGLHYECDFVLKNFDTRQSSRDDEIEALKQSVAILSGAKF